MVNGTWRQGDARLVSQELFIEVIYQIGIKYKSIKAKSSKLLTKFQVKMKVKVKVEVELEL